MSRQEPKQTPAAPAPDFEQALARLEALVKEMESGTLSLDRMMKCFEEGTELARICDKKLNEVEKKVEKLLKQGDKIVTEPLESAGESDSV